MEKQVEIAIKMTQQMDGEQDVTESVQPGKMYESNGKIYLIYEESLGDQEASVTTRVKIQEDAVTVTRNLKPKTKMEFICGKKTACSYRTPMGALLLGIDTVRYDIFQKENGFKLYLDYHMELNDVLVSFNQMVIIVRW